MQSRVIGQLARKLRSSHRKTKSWKATAAELHILTPKKMSNKSLARRIAVEDYEPSAAMFQRLMDDGALTFNKKPRQTLYIVLVAMVQALLTYLLEHREDFR